MNNSKNFKRAISTTLALTSFSTCVACTKTVECSVVEEHVHLYVDEESDLSRYIYSEKENVGNFIRTDKYLSITDDLNVVVDNELYSIEDNLEYLTLKINESVPLRQAYSYGYIYGEYTGYDFGVNPMTGDTKYYYGLHTGWHYGYEWQDISLEEYTSDEVRDITYKFKFYKINKDGTISSKLFESLDQVTKEYKYFMPTDLVHEIIGEPYYLEKHKVKKK